MHVLSKKGEYGGKKLGTFSFCDCVIGKHNHVSFKPAVHNTKGILDYIYLWVGVIIFFYSLMN